MDADNFRRRSTRSQKGAHGNGSVNAPTLQQSLPPAAQQLKALPDSTRPEDRKLQAVRQAEAQRLKTKVLNTQGATISIQQSSLIQRREVFRPELSHSSVQQGAIPQPEEGFTRGRSILKDTFSQGVQAQADPFCLLQYANQENAQARGELQYLQNSGVSRPQSYPEFDRLFATGYQTQQQNTAIVQLSSPAPNVRSQQQQQDAKDVAHLQQSPTWTSHHRAASQSGSIAIDPNLDPRLLQKHSNVQSLNQKIPVQTQKQSPDIFTTDTRGRVLSPNISYNTGPGMPVDNSLLQRLKLHHSDLLNKPSAQIHNAVQIMPNRNQNLEFGDLTDFTNSTSRPNISPTDQMTGSYGECWSQSPDRMVIAIESSLQIPRPSFSPPKMTTIKPNLVRVPQPLVPSNETVITDQALALLPASPPFRRMRRLSKQSDNLISTQDKKQKTSASTQETTQLMIPQPPMTASASSDSLKFHFPGQRTQNPFHRTFANGSSVVDGHTIAENPEPIKTPVSQISVSKPAVSNSKKPVSPRNRKASAKSAAKSSKKPPAKAQPKPGSVNAPSALPPANEIGPAAVPKPGSVDLPSAIPSADRSGLATVPNGNLNAPSAAPSAKNAGSVAAPRDGNFNIPSTNSPKPVGVSKPQQEPSPTNEVFVFNPLLPYQDPSRQQFAANSILLPPTSINPPPTQHRSSTPLIPPSTQYQPLPYLPPPEQPSGPWYNQDLSQLSRLPIGSYHQQRPYIQPPSRPWSPQPPPPTTHSDYINRTWHPQPCGCCPHGVPSELIRRGNQFRVYYNREQSAEEKLMIYMQ